MLKLWAYMRDKLLKTIKIQYSMSYHVYPYDNDKYIVYKSTKSFKIMYDSGTPTYGINLELREGHWFTKYRKYMVIPC
jgi:hypothetical protein